MSANMVASSLLTSQSLVSREPHVAHSETKGQESGFESLLADIDLPTTAADGEKSAALPTTRSASTETSSASTPLAMTTTSLDAALSLLGTSFMTSGRSAAASNSNAAPTSSKTGTSSTSGKSSTTAKSSTTEKASSADKSSTTSTPSDDDLNSIASLAMAITAAANSAVSASAGAGSATQSASNASPAAANSAPAAATSAAWPTSSKSAETLPDAAALLSSALSNKGKSTSTSKADAQPLAAVPGSALGTVSYTKQIGLSFSSDLGFQSLQTATHLGVSGPKTTSTAAVAGQTAPQAAAKAEPLTTTTGSSSHGQANTQGGQSSSSNSGRDPGAQSQPAKTVDATPTVAGLASTASVASSSDDSVSLADLGDLLVNEAQTLAPAAGDAKTATTPIKELQLNLQPANLGSVSIKLKLTGGKLSVDVGVGNSNALASVESQRDTMISKLQANAQPLESFVVHQQNFTDPSAAQTSSNSSYAGSSGNASGNEQSSQETRQQSYRQPRTPQSEPAENARGAAATTGLTV